ncbi:uncharacterized protein LDX57_001542 [Aspergillus melleus]|uniref:uncharacterized protein n=1 Tax=Aspergillus melleus TaxID=138277 RepID=UPI001E8CC492|nr:uncharacterized protein LDX57_001542 [Aspergillus melleus]KAH8423784.1 hypothetical protein LDX57_001542 [Aspergillus melleus]
MAHDSTLADEEALSDQMFGPSSRLREFDFTLTFEQIILSIIPSVIFLMAALPRLFYLFHRASRTTSGQYYYIPKSVRAPVAYETVAALANLALHVSLVVVWAVSSSTGIPTTVVAAALGLCDAIIMAVLSCVEDTKSHRPSTILALYLLFSVFLDATQVRTLWLTQSVAPAAVQSCVLATKLTMLVLETREKKFYLKSPYKDYPPEATSGILNLSFVWWLNGLFQTGYRKLMGAQDLFELDPGLASDAAGGRLERTWEKIRSIDSKFALPLAFMRTFWKELLAVVFPRLCMIGFTCSQPFLIMTAIRYVDQPGGSQDRNHGYGLIGATLLIYIGIAVSNVHYKQRFSRVVTVFRGAMIYLIYNKTLTLQDGLYTGSAALTLMSTDIDGIIEHLENFNDVWARTVEVALGLSLLGIQLGATCVVPLVLMLVCLGGQKIVANTIGKNQQNWNLQIQDRVKTTSSVLGSIKATKISGLSNPTTKKLQQLREHELTVSRDFFKGIMWLNGIATLPRIWSPVVTFIIYAIQANIKNGESLTTVKAFTALSMITLVTTPAEKLLAVVPQLAAAMGCFQRIHEYMVAESIRDNRLYQGNFLPSTTSDSSYNAGKKAITLTVAPDLREASIAVGLNNLTVSPSPKATPAALTDVSFQIERGSVLAVAGPVGSGKTTLLKAILGELDPQSGTVFVGCKMISYCSQDPWLLNTTIKKSITGLEDHQVDDNWYHTTIYSCCLEEDIRRWPEGDQSEIGSKGLTLSGGQRQRVALARAVYSRRDIALLDDVFSALDMRTQETVTARLFSHDGVFRQLGITVILATHNPRLFAIADNVISLGSDGRMQQFTTSKNAIQSATQLFGIGDVSLEQHADPTHNQILETSSATAHEPIHDIEDLDRTRQIGDFSVYLYYARAVGPLLCVLFLVAHAFLAFAESFPRVWLSWWTQANSSQLPLYLSVYVAFALAASLLIMICIWVVFLELMPRSAIRLHQFLLDAVIRAPLSFFASTDTGITLNRFSQDMTLVDLALPIALMSLGQSFFGCVATIGLIATGSAYMAITIPLALAVLYVLQKIYLKTSRQLRYLDLEAKSPLYSQFVETLEGLPTIRAFGWQSASTDMLVKHLDASQKPYYMLICAQRWLNLVLDLVVMALAVLVVTLAVLLRDKTNAGLLGVALNNILGFNQLLSSFISSWTQLETSLGAIARVKSFVENTPFEYLVGEGRRLSEAWPEKGGIDIQGVCINYADGSTALRDVSMTIAPGEKVGICGRTGR